MKYRELTKRLEELGCEFVRQAAGSHEIWWNPANKKFTVIPRHGGRDIPLGTIRAILRQLGIDPKDFYAPKKGRMRRS
ncbi:MAG TPA: type II toxin-antitoxin system HicA family toxin [Chloroflexi bacterium]|nr:type II toxin-antitoxin system HicA family toxin [Chloroflexota bacterium]